MSMNINVDMDFNPDILAENLQKLHAIAKRGTETVGIFAAENKIPIKVEMKRQSSGSYEVTVSSCNNKYKNLARTIVFPKEKNKDKLRSKIIDKTQREINRVGENVYHNMTLMERLDFLPPKQEKIFKYIPTLQNQAYSFIEAGKETDALKLLRKATDLLISDRGQKELEELSVFTQRADPYRSLAYSFIEADRNDEALELLRKAADLLISEKGQKELKALEPTVRADPYRSLAYLFIEAGGNDEALELLNLAVDLLIFEKGQKELKALEPLEHADEYKDLADLFIQAGGNEKALELLNLAAEILDSPEGQNELKALIARSGLVYAYHERFCAYQELADLFIKVGENKKALELLNLALAALKTSEGEGPKNMKPIKRADEYRKLADLFIKTGENNKGLELLNLATEILDSLEDQPRGMELIHLANAYRNLADLFIKAGENEEGPELLNHAADLLLVFGKDYEGLLSDSQNFSIYIDNLLSLNEQLIESGDGAKAKAIFYWTETTLKSLSDLLSKAGYGAPSEQEKIILDRAKTALKSVKGWHVREKFSLKKRPDSEQRLPLMDRLKILRARITAMPAAWQGLDHIKELRTQAWELINAGKKNEAMDLLKQATEILDSPEGQNELKALVASKYVYAYQEYVYAYKKLALLFKKAGENEKAKKLFGQAADLLLVSDGSYERLERMPSTIFTIYIDNLLSSAEQLIESGDGAKARAVFEPVKVVLNVDKNRTIGRKISVFTQGAFTNRLEALRARIDATNY